MVHLEHLFAAGPRLDIEIPYLVRDADRGTYEKPVHQSTKDSVEKEISDHYGRAHPFKLRIQFPVTNKSAITPSAIEWLLDDRPVAASILMPSFLYNPKEMEASLRDIFKDKISFNAPGRYQEAFPIECYYRWSDPSTGCAVKAK